MGIGFFGSNSSCICETPLSTAPNPNPYNYRVIECKEISGFVVMRVKYPDCTNFEGEKVLVFKASSEFDVRGKKFLDPHFCKNSKLVARFVPTTEGYKMAIKLCKILSGEI